MKAGSSHNTLIEGLIGDSLVIILIFVSTSIIDLQVAAFMGVICAFILFARRVLHDYNPGFIVCHHISYNKEELIVPKGVDVFDLSKVPTMRHLQRYIQIRRGILAPPAALIIRFCGILQFGDYELFLLTEIIGRLQKSDIAVIFSDVGNKVQLQFAEFDVEQKLGSENICHNVNDALKRADKVLHEKKIK